MADLNWPSVGVAWAFSVLTLIILFASFKLFQLIKRHRDKRSRQGNYLSNIYTGSNRSSHNDSRLQPLMHDTSLASAESRGQCSDVISTGVVTSSRGQGQSAGVSKARPDRRARDDVTMWCTENNLPECFVQSFRQCGFVTTKSLNGLRSSDVNTLPSLTPAMRVQLREALEKTELQGSSRQGSSWSESKRKSSLPSKTPSSSVDYDGVFLLPDISDGQLGSVSGHSSTSGIKAHGNSFNKPSVIKESSSEIDNPNGFRGLLSNAGLWELTDMIGHEWRQLGTLLNISHKTQEQLVESYPHAARQHIYEMLRLWRDRARGTKEGIKGVLCEALKKIRRKDIVEKLLREQARGSDERLNFVPRSVV